MNHLPDPLHWEAEFSSQSPCSTPEHLDQSPSCEGDNVPEHLASNTDASFSSIIMSKPVFSLKVLLLKGKCISVPTY